MTAAQTATEPAAVPAAAPAAAGGHSECVAVGLAEIAERCGVLRKTANMWRDRTKKGEMREGLPEPVWTVGGGPAWCWPHQVEPWARRTRRLPVPESVPAAVPAAVPEPG